MNEEEGRNINGDSSMVSSKKQRAGAIHLIAIGKERVPLSRPDALATGKTWGRRISFDGGKAVRPPNEMSNAT